jgi:hypothetical protein
LIGPPQTPCKGALDSEYGKLLFFIRIESDKEEIPSASLPAGRQVFRLMSAFLATTFPVEKAGASEYSNYKQHYLEIIAWRMTFQLPVRIGKFVISACRSNWLDFLLLFLSIKKVRCE